MAKALKSRGNSWGFTSIIAIYLILIIIQMKIVRFEPIVKNTFLSQKFLKDPLPKKSEGIFFLLRKVANSIHPACNSSCSSDSACSSCSSSNKNGLVWLEGVANGCQVVINLSSHCSPSSQIVEQTVQK